MSGGEEEVTERTTERQRETDRRSADLKDVFITLLLLLHRLAGQRKDDCWMRGNGAVHVCAGVCATLIVPSINAMQRWQQRDRLEEEKKWKKTISVQSAT